MNLNRYEEVKTQLRKINDILAKWDRSMNEDDYYSLKETLRQILAYTMNNTDAKHKHNPLIDKYYKRVARL